MEWEKVEGGENNEHKAELPDGRVIHIFSDRDEEMWDWYDEDDEDEDEIFALDADTLEEAKAEA